ncbi:NUDIX domain-containing protein [Mechercharimyces sp. CAU 1602]|uniref:NUDIX domain-containing protein n=1 Tax=Mechercharimyces sp. CAU 1602 TaxID=2973933 RepID=UPI00216311B5|nr:NUDIX domain-containing protein [Mechercharimyces sp. CAU 1602]MCS1350132.1 NUDIX domain-containing protein [Mechercharimyces sp. CAU 1602]
MHKDYKIAAKAIIFEQEKVLVLTRSLAERRSSEHHGWDFPGGGLEPSELLMDGLAREVKEETGLTVRVAGPAYIYDEVKEDKHLVVIKFSCYEPKGDVRLSEEHDRFEWIEMSKLDQSGLPEWMKDEVKRAYALYREAALT